MKRLIIMIFAGTYFLFQMGCTDPIITEIETLNLGGSPVTPSVAGGAFYLAVKITSDTPGEDMYGSCFDILYDTNYITFAQGAGDVVINGGSLGFDYSTDNYRNGQQDRLVVCVSKEGQVAGDTGYGELVRLKFNTLQAGVTGIQFSDQYLVHASGNNSPIQMPDGLITIN